MMNPFRGPILGKALFDGDLFGTDAGKVVGMECAHTVTRHAFSPFALLKLIDSSAQGSLNDTAVTDYYRIEIQLGYSTLKRTTHLLNSHNAVYHVQKTANRLSVETIGVKHNGLGASNHRAQYGDSVKFNLERNIRLLLKN